VTDAPVEAPRDDGPPPGARTPVVTGPQPVQAVPAKPAALHRAFRAISPALALASPARPAADWDGRVEHSSGYTVVVG
jgi:hypothetical protein